MNDNDILIARKTEGGCRSVVIDGDTADFERQNRRVKDRQAAEEAKRTQEAEFAKRRQAEKEAAERAAYTKRRKQILMAVSLAVTTAAMIGLIHFGQMTYILGMAFNAVIAAVYGRNMK